MGTRLTTWALGLGLGLAALCARGQGTSDDWGAGVHWTRNGNAGYSRAAAVPAEPVAAAGEPGTGMPSWLSERLTLGVGVSRVRLSDNHRKPERPHELGKKGATFLGALNLMELEDETLLVPVATYWVARYLRAKASWESMEARVFNYNDSDPYGPHGQTDGIAELRGPVFSLEGVWPLMDDTLFPHVGGGIFWGFADFREDTFWHLGYSNQEAWEMRGKTKKTATGHYREIHVDDTLGWILSAGVAWRPARHFEIDLEMRKTWATSDAEYGYVTSEGWDPHHPGEFSFENVAWTLSVAWVF